MHQINRHLPLSSHTIELGDVMDNELGNCDNILHSGDLLNKSKFQSEIYQKQVQIKNCLSGINDSLKLPSLFINVSQKHTHMNTLYSNLSLFITFTMINYIREE